MDNWKSQRWRILAHTSSPTEGLISDSSEFLSVHVDNEDDNNADDDDEVDDNDMQPNERLYQEFVYNKQ